MVLTKREALFKRVVLFYENNGGNNDHKFAISATIRHFVEEGLLQPNISRMIARYRITGSDNHLKSSGRPVFRDHNGVKDFVEQNPEESVRTGSSKLKMPTSTFQWIKLKKFKKKGYVKPVVPKHSGDQEARAKRACRVLYKRTVPSGGSKTLILDDETYVPLDPSQVPGKEYYHSDGKENVKDSVRFRKKQKFAKRFLVWQAIDFDGNVSEPFITTGTINGNIYLEECVKKRLIPFIEKYHNKEDVIFWPDMATAHYAQAVQQFLNGYGVEYVSKTMNAPNVPHVRPIERFWSLCKKAYKSRRSGAKSLRGFKTIWSNISKKVAEDSGKNIVKGLKKKLRLVGYQDILAPLRSAK
jgi:hypothetical protein